ncbi:MAG: DUF4126 domain-containing protein [Cycloclasticus sp.]|nr:DUF4126 domain-containing protein [Cycloclasticus sp.]MBQ0790825.1 DUF4126 domain-containing protein [Cycloclasticus sp.]
MDELNQLSQTLALSMGAAWGSGINLYATILMIGLLAHNGQIVLPSDLMIVADPLVMTAAGLMYAIEFFADKIPGVDSAWDTLHTFIRIPAGAMLAAGAIGDIGPAAEIAAALVGGSLAAATHATKAGSRALINTSPEPFSNWTASIAEDIAVFVGVWASIQHPAFFIVGLVLFILLMIWALPKLWRGIKRVFRFLLKLFGVSSAEEDYSKPMANDKLPRPD